MEPRELRAEATLAFAKGRFAQAAEAYDAYCRLDRKDLQARLRLGDAWTRAGDKDKAVAAYRWAAEGFAGEGFLPRAIAAAKLVLELEPGHRQVQQMLAGLYARRAPPAARKPPSPAPATPGPSPDDLSLAVTVRLPVEQLQAALVPGELHVALPASTPPGAEAPWRPSVAARAQAGQHGLSELEASLQALAESGLPEDPPPVAPSGEGPRPAFTELELEPEQLLHAVEEAAFAGSSVSGLNGLEDPLEVTEAAPTQLPRIPLFSDLPPEAFVALFEECPLRRFEVGQRVVEEGTRGDAFYVICAGRVRVVRREGAGEKELARLDEGAFFGEMALLSEAPRSASVEVLDEDTQVLEISAPVLARLSRQHPSVAQALKRFCRQRLLANLLSSARLFTSLTRAERRALIERFRAREVRAGDVVVRQGGQPDGLYVVLSGEVEVSIGGAPVARLREGDVFGEMSLLGAVPASATVAAARRTSLLRLPRPDVEALLATHPQVRAHLEELGQQRDAVNRGLSARPVL